MTRATLTTFVSDFARDRRRRLLLYAVAAIVAVTLSIFPRPYVAKVKILPQDSQAGAGALIAALGGGAQNFAAVLGGQKTNYLVIGRSHDVQQEVVERLGLSKVWNTPDLAAAERRLSRKVDIQLLTGGVLEVTARDSDPDFALLLVQGFTSTIKERLAALGLERVDHKREIVTTRLHEANAALASAEAALNTFRVQNNLPSPEAELGAAVGRRLTLDAQIRAKEVEIEVARQFQTDQSLRVRTLMSELAALRRQRQEAADASDQANGVALSARQAEYVRLYRDQQFAEGIVQVYRRFFEEVNVEAMSALTNVQIIERPHIDPERHFNLPAIALLLLVLLGVAFTEVYMPMTGLGRRPMRSASRPVEELT